MRTYAVIVFSSLFYNENKKQKKDTNGTIHKQNYYPITAKILLQVMCQK
jgi:hypothetical protein